MTRATLRWSAALSLSTIIVAVALWWSERSIDTLSAPEASAVPAAAAKTTEPLQSAAPTQSKTQLQAELEQLPAALRQRYRIPADAQSIARLGVDLADVNWQPLFNYLDDSEYPLICDELKSRAENGDPEAAYFLWEALQFCQRAGQPPMSEAEFAEELQMIREDHQVPVYRDGKRRVVSVAEINMPAAAAESIARLNHERCNDMPMENRGEAIQWRDFATLNGSRTAISAFAQELGREGDPSALMDMWNDGDPMALNSLAAHFAQQYEAGTDPAGHTKSFAYWLAFREIHYASRMAAGPGSKSFFGNVEIETFRARRQLLPGQIAEAEDLATEILQNRPTGCCISLDVPK